MPLEYADQTADQLLSLPRDRTVYFFPVGGLTDRGKHLPVSLDLHHAKRLCQSAAERLEHELPGWTGVLLPAVPLTIDPPTTRFSISQRAHVLRDYLVDSCLGLHRSGFRYFVCLSGAMTPRTLTAIEDAGRVLRRRSGMTGLGRLVRRGAAPILISASSVLPSPKHIFESPLWPDPVEHGAAHDVSVALATVPTRVDPEYKLLPSVVRQPNRWLRLKQLRTRNLGGYWGSPAQGTELKGNQILKDELDTIFIKFRAVLEGSNPGGLFRSWYSVFPPNWSFFKAWAMLVAIVLILMAWVWLSFRMLTTMG